MEGQIIRAGFKSHGFLAGNAEVCIAGTFSQEDADDLIELLQIVIRSVKRQANSSVLAQATIEEDAK